MITQEELTQVADLQAAEWLAAQTAHKAVLTLRARLRHGAAIEPGALTFDHELKMVRTRKKRGA